MFHFKESNRYRLKTEWKVYSRNPRTVKYGTETILYLASKKVFQ